MPQTKVTESETTLTYSTSEVDTGKKWVDGRTVFRKVFRGQVNVIAGLCSIPHGIAMTNSLEVISLNGGVKLTQTGLAGGQLQTFQYRETAGNWISVTNVDLTNINFTSSFAWGNSAYSIIMEYVK